MQEICFLSVHNTCTVMENDDIFTWKDAPQRGKGGYVVGVRDNRNFQPKGVPGPWGRKQSSLYN